MRFVPQIIYNVLTSLFLLYIMPVMTTYIYNPIIAPLLYIIPVSAPYLYNPVNTPLYI